MRTPAFFSNNDSAAVEALVVEHLEFADSIARRYTGRGVDGDDLTQVARMALVKAAQRFDPAVGHSFAAYASPCISGEIKRHFRDAGWMIRPPRRLQELGAEYRQVGAELTHRLGRPATRTELATALRIDSRELNAIEKAAGVFSCLSLDAPAPNGDRQSDDYARVAAGPHIEEPSASIEDRDWLVRALSGLSDREQRLIRLRFADAWTQTQIADHLGVSQMQVSRILRATLAALRTAMNASLTAT